jgi:hypothetical protein
MRVLIYFQVIINKYYCVCFFFIVIREEYYEINSSRPHQHFIYILSCENNIKKIVRKI